LLIDFSPLITKLFQFRGRKKLPACLDIGTDGSERWWKSIQWNDQQTVHANERWPRPLSSNDVNHITSLVTPLGRTT